jgi:LysM repeat protein
MFKQSKKFDLSPRLKLGVGRGYSQSQILKIASIVCLVLAVGLTANTIRILFSHKDSSSQTPQVLGATDTKTSNTNVEFIEYKVQKGDTLFNISQKNNIDWTTLATLNNLQSPYVVKSGQTLKIPKQ